MWTASCVPAEADAGTLTRSVLVTSRPVCLNMSEGVAPLTRAPSKVTPNAYVPAMVGVKVTLYVLPSSCATSEVSVSGPTSCATNGSTPVKASTFWSLPYWSLALKKKTFAGSPTTYSASNSPKNVDLAATVSPGRTSNFSFPFLMGVPSYVTRTKYSPLVSAMNATS